MDQILPETMKTLDMVLSWLTHLFRSGTVPAEWQTGMIVLIFKKGDQRVFSTYWVSHCSASAYARVLVRRLQTFVNLRSRRSNVDSIRIVEQWTSSLLLQGCWVRPGGLPIQSTCVLWTWGRPQPGPLGSMVGVWVTGDIATRHPVLIKPV